MNEYLKRIDELVNEIKSLTKTKDAIDEENRKLKMKLLNQKEETIKAQDQVQILKGEIRNLMKQIEHNEKANTRSRKILENESKRKEQLNTKILGSTKSQKEYFMSLEMKEVNDRYLMMSKFISALGERFKFDCEVFNDLLEIAEGFDDPVIRVFLDTIKVYSKENDSNINDIDPPSNDS